MEHTRIGLVDHIILAAAGQDVQLLGGDHVVELTGLVTGGIDHGFGLQRLAGGGLHQPHLSLPADAGDGGVQLEVGAVLHSVLRQSDGQLVGADDGAGGHPQGPSGGGTHMGLLLPQLRFAEDLQAGHAVGLAPLAQNFQLREVVSFKGDDQRTVALKGHFQLGTQLVKHAVAFHVIFRLQRAFLGVISAVYNGGIGLGAAALRHVGSLVHHQDIQIPAGELPGNGTAHYAGADDDHISYHMLFLTLSSIFYTSCIRNRDPRPNRPGDTPYRTDGAFFLILRYRPT